MVRMLASSAGMSERMSASLWVLVCRFSFIAADGGSRAWSGVLFEDVCERGRHGERVDVEDV
jgi:hypothetical protein